MLINTSKPINKYKVDSIPLAELRLGPPNTPHLTQTQRIVGKKLRPGSCKPMLLLSIRIIHAYTVCNVNDEKQIQGETIPKH